MLVYALLCSSNPDWEREASREEGDIAVRSVYCGRTRFCSLKGLFPSPFQKNTIAPSVIRKGNNLGYFLSLTSELECNNLGFQCLKTSHSITVACFFSGGLRVGWEKCQTGNRLCLYNQSQKRSATFKQNLFVHLDTLQNL